ncbi:MAG: mechanosensitive ion channel domain-containing protein [archaeon]
MVNSIQLSDPVIKVIVALVIIIFGLVFGRFLGKLTKKLLKELEVDRILKEQTRINFSVEDLLGSIVQYIIYIIAIIIALNQLGLTQTILYIVLGAILVIIIIIIILALKDFIPNIIAGFFIHQKSLISKGDRIKIKDVEGTILYVSLIETKIKTRTKDIVYIPNSLLIKNIVVKKDDNNK